MPEDKQAEEVKKGYTFACGGCGMQWEHKVKNTSGLCKTCVELRRATQAFLNKGLIGSKVELLERLEKVLRDTA